MIIRLANRSDLDDLVQLNDQIQRQHAQQYPGEFKYPVDPAAVKDFFVSLLDRENHTVIVAIDSGRTVAYLYYELHEIRQNTFKSAKSRYYIHHVLVDESVRRTGTASALFDWVEKDARASGVSQVALDTWTLNKGAHKFFEQKGFQLTQLIFSKPLE